MKADRDTLIDMEKRFWQSMVDEKTDVALDLLAEPSFMVSSQGAMKFDHATYRRMAEHGPMVIRRFELGPMETTFVGEGTAILSYPVTQVLAPRQATRPGSPAQEIEQRMSDTSTWVKVDGAWRCAMHTETPMPSA